MLLSLILDNITHAVTRSQFMKVRVYYSIYVTHNNSYVNGSFEEKNYILVAIFVVTRDLNVRI